MKKTELRNLVKEVFTSIIKEQESQETPATIDGEVDDEGQLVKSELLYIADKAKGCADKIEGDEQQVHAWVQSHISAAKELISHVADYMGYTEEETDETDEEETEEPEQEEDSTEEFSSDEETGTEPPTKNQPVTEEVTSSQLHNAKKSYLNLKKQKIDQELKNPESSLEEKNQETDEQPEVPVNIPRKIKRDDADKIKDLGKELAARGEHAKILKMIKKIEDYIKNLPQ